MTMKAHTYYIIFGRPPIGGKLPPFPPGGATGVKALQELYFLKILLKTKQYSD